MTPRQTRTQRLAMPLARDVVRELAVTHGGCIRPVQLRRTDIHTGQVEQVLVPCGHTLATVCPSCAERAKALRAAQCREGWHLETEPIITPDDPDDLQLMSVEHRAETQQQCDQAEAAGRDTSELDELAAELDEEITRSGVRGNVLPGRPERRHRSTRRRQDAPDLPRRAVAPRTIGKTYTTPDGKTFRPSMFITLTCDSYGKVGGTALQLIRALTTTSGRPVTRCTSRRCSTGSSRTCAGSSAMTSNISPRSSHSGGSPRTSMWRSAALCPAPNCGRCSPRPITRCGGLPSARSGTTTRTCPSGTSPAVTTSIPRPASSCRPGMTR